MTDQGPFSCRAHANSTVCLLFKMCAQGLLRVLESYTISFILTSTLKQVRVGISNCRVQVSFQISPTLFSSEMKKTEDLIASILQ